jgi:hypothetical protein
VCLLSEFPQKLLWTVSQRCLSLHKALRPWRFVVAVETARDDLTRKISISDVYRYTGTMSAGY